MTEIYAVYGASGCGRSLMPVARQQLQRQHINAEIYFIDDSLIDEIVINGHTALNYAAFKNLKADRKSVLIAIANSQIREKIAINLEQDAIELWTVQADNDVRMEDIDIAPGASLSTFVNIASNTKIS